MRLDCTFRITAIRSTKMTIYS